MVILTKKAKILYGFLFLYEKFEKNGYMNDQIHVTIEQDDFFQCLFILTFYFVMITRT
jgi:hypothetical protein